MAGEQPDQPGFVRRTTRTVRPANRGTRYAVGIPLAVVGLALIALGALHDGPAGVRVTLIVVGAGLLAAGCWLVAGAIGIGSGNANGGNIPGASPLPYVETEEIRESGFPKEGNMPPKQGDMPPKDGT